MDQELKPCPFCGGEAQKTKGEYYHEGWAFCTKCNAFGPTVPMDEIVDAWNRRAQQGAKP